MIKSIKFGKPLIFNPKGTGIEYWSNTFNGTFSNGSPISIMINKGHVIRDNSCHHAWGFPESVLWIKKDGSKGVSRVRTYTQIPGHRDISFAIGGVGISNYNPKAEGFSVFDEINTYTREMEHKEFEDVLDKTDHSVFGFKDNLFFASIMYGTPLEIKAECEKQGYALVVMGDGRSWAACNTKEFNLNLDKIQYSAVQVYDLVDIPLVTEPKKKWNWFTYDEFANKQDGGANETKEELVDKCDNLRELTRRSTSVLSGFRTWFFNNLPKVRGSKNSYHPLGLAADLRFNFKGYTWTSLSAICKYLGFTNIGFYWTFGRIGWRLNRIHVDIGPPRNGKKFCIMHWNSNGKFIKKT